MLSGSLLRTCIARHECVDANCSSKNDSPVGSFGYGKLFATSPGKISEHGHGIGAPSPEEVERRAREIAMIDERNPDEFTEADWAQARHELRGEENNVPPEETPDNAEMTEEWSVIASSKGHHIPRPGTQEEETVGEHLVIEGIEEATHDQMLEARREERDQEGENP